jgi:phospholipid N-methyltransferase
MGMSRHDAYYEPEDEPNDDEIRFRTDELMRTKEYDAYQTDHIVEALSDMSVKDAEALQLVLDTKDHLAIGRKIWDITYSYMEKFAESQAIDEIEN